MGKLVLCPFQTSPVPTTGVGGMEGLVGLVGLRENPNQGRSSRWRQQPTPPPTALPCARTPAIVQEIPSNSLLQRCQIRQNGVGFWLRIIKNLASPSSPFLFDCLAVVFNCFFSERCTKAEDPHLHRKSRRRWIGAVRKLYQPAQFRKSQQKEIQSAPSAHTPRRMFACAVPLSSDGSTMAASVPVLPVYMLSATYP